MSRWLRLIVAVALLGAPAVVRAQGGGAGAGRAAPGGPNAAAAGLVAERQKLRTELDRVNAQIDGLKHDNRGLREDYRLRARMADAEALAQRLTDLDVRIERLNPTAARRPEPPLAAAPEARPSDDRAALEAKADILADQARRLEHQADVLAGRVGELRGRQELRRRAGQLERDPFSPLEQSKRRVGGTVLAMPGPKDLPGGGPPRTGTTGTPGTGTMSPTEGTPTTAPGTPTSPGAVTGGGTPAMPPTGSGTDAVRSASSTTGVTAPTAMPVGALSGTDAPGSVAGQFRGVLDASTLAEIRRLESAGAPGSNLQAMERALAALRARAAQLNAGATSLRARAKTTP